MSTDKMYRAEVEDCMQYAKWFRPFNLFTLFSTIFSSIIIGEKAIEYWLER